MDYTKIVCVGIIAIAAMESIAIFRQIDGTNLAAAIGAVGAIVGAALKGYFDSRKAKD